MIRDPSDGSVKRPPSLGTDLKAKYGENYGLGESEEAKPKTITPAPTSDQLRKHYSIYDLEFVPKESDDMHRNKS